MNTPSGSQIPQSGDLALLHTSEVTEEQIDSLGHMNVRFYVSRMGEASRELFERSGVLGGCDASRLRRIDTYTRFLREQFSGATLETRGGFIAGGSDDGGADGLLAGLPGTACYFEIRNADTGDLAALFIVRIELVDVATDRVLAAPTREALQGSGYAMALPAYAYPRTLNFTEPGKVELADLSEAVTENPVIGMMSGRREGVVLPEDCDDRGRLRDDLDVMFLIARAQLADTSQPMGPPVQTDDQGRRFSWAMMETRSVQYRRPASGDRVVSIGADIAWSEKWRHARRWTFVQDTGELLGIADSVGVCIDLDARKAIPIPEELQQAIAENELSRFA